MSAFNFPFPCFCYRPSYIVGKLEPSHIHTNWNEPTKLNSEAYVPCYILFKNNHYFAVC